MREMRELIQNRKEAQIMLREAEQKIVNEMFNLHIAIKTAIVDNIVKPNFPLSHYMRKELERNIGK